MTKGTLRDRVVSQMVEYAPLLKVSPQIIDQFGEYATREVWRTLVVAQEGMLRRTVVVNHGDPLPDDWVAYGNRAYYTVAGVATPVPLRYIPVDLVPTRRVAAYNHASTMYPDFYSSDQECKFLPDTTMIDPTTLQGGINYNPSFPNGQHFASNLTSVTLHYYPRPAKLFGDSIPDSTDNGLPEFTDTYVVRNTLKRVLEYLVAGPKREQMMKQAREEEMKSIGELFTRLQAVQLKEVQQAV